MGGGAFQTPILCEGDTRGLGNVAGTENRDESRAKGASIEERKLLASENTRFSMVLKRFPLFFSEKEGFRPSMRRPRAIIAQGSDNAVAV